MKLSNQTINILKNFAIINQNIFIEKGDSVVKTISASKSFYSEATIKEVMPNDVAIFNLNQFLKTLSMFENPEIEFEDKFLNIKEENGNTKYKYMLSDKACLHIPPGRIEKFDCDFEFEISEEDINKLLQVSRVSELPHMLLDFDGENVRIDVMISGNQTSNVYSMELQGEGSKPCKAMLKIDNLKLMNGDYRVGVTSSKSRWEYLGGMDLFYVLAMMSIEE